MAKRGGPVKERSTARRRPRAPGTGPDRQPLLDAVLGSSLAGIAILRGSDFRFQIASPSYRAIDPRRKLLGRTFAECWPEAAAQLVPVLEKLLRDGETVHAEDVRFELVRGGGGVREEAFFTYTFQRVDPDGTGEPAILVTTVETTAQVNARRRAEAGEERLRLALEASRSGLWEWDLRTDENAWTDGLWDLYGLRRAGRTPSYETWRHSLHPLDRDRAEEAVRSSAARGEPLEVDYRVRTRDGSERWLAARGAPVRDESGKVVRYRGVVFDVTLAKREALLAAEKERADALQQAVASLPIGVVLVELPPGGPPALTGHNAAYRRIVTAAPSRPTPIAQLGHAMYHPDRTTPIPPSDWPGPRAARTGEVVHDEELHVRRADGSWRILSLSAAPIGSIAPGRTRRAVAVLLDVTEQKEAAARLAESEARFRTLFDTLPEGVVFQDPAGRIVLANAAACRILDTTLDEMLGRTSHDPRWRAIRPDGAPFSGEEHPAMVALRTGNRVADVVMGMAGLTNGETRWIQIDAVPEPGVDGGAPVGVYTIFRDVTDARLRLLVAQTQVRLQQHGVGLSFPRFVTAMLDEIETLTESRGACLYAVDEGQATIRLVGTSTSSAGALPGDRVGSARPVEPSGILAEAMGTGAPVVREQAAIRLPPPDATSGPPVFGGALVIPLRRGERVRALLCVGDRTFPYHARDVEAARLVAEQAWDVAEKLRADEALRESEARFRDVAASAGEYVFEMDTRGVITYISDAAEKVLGYRPEELVGRSSLELMDADEQARSLAFLGGKVARRERFAHFEQTAVHRSGRRVWLDITGLPILAGDGTLVGFRGTAMDVTERHEAERERERLEAQLSQAQKMEVVGRLAGGVAHDFNNLLTVILTCAHGIREDVDAGAPPDGEQVADILTAAQRAADLTRQLLAFARRQVVAPADVDLNDLVRQARKLLGRVIGEDVQVTEALQPGLRVVRCDPGLLSQVVMNLAVNARDAMPRGGTLRLATANLTLRPGEPAPDPEMPPGDYVELSVKDSGVGMPADVLAHVFEPFYTTKPVGVGTGLGLATVYGIVKQSNGFVTVRSEAGQGSEFRVFLPALPPGARARPLPVPRESGGSETLLVVEDEPKVREVTAHVLRAAGYRVLLAASGEEALALLGGLAEPVHLVVTDVVMRGMGGPDLAREVTALRPGTPVLFVSGFTRDAIARHGVLDEGLHFLSKPFTPDVLRARVREVLDLGRA